MEKLHESELQALHEKRTYFNADEVMCDMFSKNISYKRVAANIKYQSKWITIGRALIINMESELYEKVKEIINDINQ